MVVSNFSGPPAPTTVYHNGGSLRSPKTSSFPQHFVSPFALSFEIWNFKKQISKLQFFFKHIFQKLSRRVGSFRNLAETLETNPWPWCGSCSRENGPICAWARWWRLFPMFFLKTLAREAAQQLASEQSLKWEPLQLGSSQLEMIEDIPLLVLLGRLAGIGLRRPFATAPPHPQHGKTICSVFLLFACLLRLHCFSPSLS